MSIKFPNVPIADGIPPVLRSVAAPVFAVVAPLLSDSVRPQDQGQWGIYDLNGNQVLIPDSINAFELAPESRVADYPIEGGSFESYNKVEMPFSARFNMTKVGTKAERTAFLDLLENMRLSTEIFDVVTPEKTYLNTTLTRYDITRNSDTGPQMLRVTVVMDQVRLQATVTFSNERSPDAVTTQSGGSVQATTPSPAPSGTPK